MLDYWERQIIEAMNAYDEAEDGESRYNEIFHDLENEKAPAGDRGQH